MQERLEERSSTGRTVSMYASVSQRLTTGRALVAMLLVMSIAFLAGCTGSADSSSSGQTSVELSVPSKTASETNALMRERADDEGFAVIDVRTPAEYALGHLEGAANIDYYSDDFKQDIDVLDRSKTYVVYCRCGKRGAATVQVMQEMGFIDVYNLQDGFLEWEYERLPEVV